MARKHRGTLLATLGFVCGTCAFASGCHCGPMFGHYWTSQEAPVVGGPRVMAVAPAGSPFLAHAAPAGPPRNVFSALGWSAQAQPQAPRVIQPGEEIHWSLQTPEMKPGVVREGRAMVGPEGSVVVGPYGSYKVAGQTVEQASTALQQQLTPYVKNPQVTVRVNNATETPAGDPQPAAKTTWRTARPTIVYPSPTTPNLALPVETAGPAMPVTSGPIRVVDSSGQEILINPEATPHQLASPAPSSRWSFRWPWKTGSKGR